MVVNELNADGVFWGGVLFMLASVVVGMIIKWYFSKQR